MTIPVLPGTQNPLSLFGQGFGQSFAQNVQRKIQQAPLNNLLAQISGSNEDYIGQPSMQGEMSQADTSLNPQFPEQRTRKDKFNSLDFIKGISSLENPDDRKIAFELLKEKQKQLATQKEDLKSTELGEQLLPFMPEKLASLWPNLSTGGKTQVVRYMVDQLERGESPLGESSISPYEAKETLVEKIIDQEKPKTNQKLDFDKGLKPAERIRREDSRYRINTPLYEDMRSQLQAYESEGRLVDRLDQLNETGKLPHDIGRINVNPSTGMLILPFGSNDETQLFVKTVNDFLSGAKDTFGARVTNFEVDRFLARLPTLANTEGGRRLILKQMKLINELNKLKNKGTIDQINKHGIRKIDMSSAEELGEKSIDKDKKQLLKKWENLDGLIGKEEDKSLNEYRKQVSEGKVLILSPTGEYGQVKKENVDKYLKEGYKLI